MAKRKKKAKGFKVSDSFVCYNKDNKLFLLSLSAHNSLEKCAKTTQIPPEKCDNTKIAKFKVDKIAKIAKSSTIKGEYCPKITGCCWDYTQKKKKTMEEDTKNVA